jgi:hypothetical protein
VLDIDGCHDQRRFGSDFDLSLSNGTTSVGAEILRFATRDTAALCLRIGFIKATIQVQATPTEMRELAARLIDAAHDIEAFPAAMLEGGAA